MGLSPRATRVRTVLAVRDRAMELHRAELGPPFGCYERLTATTEPLGFGGI
jgi:hypothetical protein